MRNDRPLGVLIPVVALLLVLALQIATYLPSEPFYNNDETRHVMTGVFFRDFLQHHPVVGARDYAINYYLQYPALGLALYPPLFYVIEGVVMLLLGITVVTAKGLVIAFLLVGCLYLYVLTRLQGGGPNASVVAMLLFAFSPIVFTLSHQVMLEIPTIAFLLMGIYHLQRYLNSGQRPQIIWATIGGIGAALTRFNGVLFIPIAVAMILLEGNLVASKKRELMIAGTFLALTVIPFYLVTWLAVGWVHSKQIFQEGPAHMGVVERLIDYPRHLPGQMGWPATIACAIGFMAALRRSNLKASTPFLALILATYLLATPVAVHGSRYAIYWVPAFAGLGGSALNTVGKWLRSPSAAVCLGLAVCAAGIWAALHKRLPYVHGYSDAAKYVLAHTQRGHYCLFDGALNGDFIYQVRLNDPQRKIWVLRGDRILYSVLWEPTMGYEDPLRTGGAMLTRISDYGPEYITVEEPTTFRIGTPAGDRLRALLRADSSHFRLVASFPVQSNEADVEGTMLNVYRSLGMKPREKKVSFDMPALRTKLEVPDSPR